VIVYTTADCHTVGVPASTQAALSVRPGGRAGDGVHEVGAKLFNVGLMAVTAKPFGNAKGDPLKEIEDTAGSQNLPHDWHDGNINTKNKMPGHSDMESDNQGQASICKAVNSPGAALSRIATWMSRIYILEKLGWALHLTAILRMACNSNRQHITPLNLTANWTKELIITCALRELRSNSQRWGVMCMACKSPAQPSPPTTRIPLERLYRAAN